MRSTAQRQSDAVQKLEHDEDVWVATADVSGVPHLVPLSLCWYDGNVIVAVEAASRTARNASASGQARLALGPTRDVVMIDAAATITATSGTAPAIAAAYHARTGWDPGKESGDWVYIVLHPTRIQAWRDVKEITARTIMRNGTWLPT
jgi:hypothetical protein